MACRQLLKSVAHRNSLVQRSDLNSRGGPRTLTRNHRIGSLVDGAAFGTCEVSVTLFSFEEAWLVQVEHLVLGQRGQLQVVLQLIAVLHGAHSEFDLVLSCAWGLLTRHKEVVEGIPNVFNLFLLIRMSFSARPCVQHCLLRWLQRC